MIANSDHQLQIIRPTASANDSIKSSQMFAHLIASQRWLAKQLPPFLTHEPVTGMSSASSVQCIQTWTLVLVNLIRDGDTNALPDGNWVHWSSDAADPWVLPVENRVTHPCVSPSLGEVIQNALNCRNVAVRLWCERLVESPLE